MRVAGVGCSVVDVLYEVPGQAGSARMDAFLAQGPGDGGLARGAAVTCEALELRFGRSAEDIAAEIAGGSPPTRTLGGVAIASLVAAAQLVEAQGIRVRFHGHFSADEEGLLAQAAVDRSPVEIVGERRRAARYPTTLVLNERHPGRPSERSFVAAAGMPAELALHPEELGPSFFGSEVTLYSAIWWEPALHAALTRLLAEARSAGSLTVVGTAFDPARSLGGPRWPLGDSDEAYRHVELLVMDRVEALVHSGESTLPGAVSFFREVGVGALLVTAGLKPVTFWSSGRRFLPGEGELPLPSALLDDQAAGRIPTGDTVGCGDCFVGGVVASVAQQLGRGGPLRLGEACRVGCLSGCIASTHRGGVYQEGRRGERLGLLTRYLAPYEAQLAGQP